MGERGGQGVEGEVRVWDGEGLGGLDGVGKGREWAEEGRGRE